MKSKIFKTATCKRGLFIAMAALCINVAQAGEPTDKVVYSWSSPTGTVIETGGTIEQHNSTIVPRINYTSSGYHTINLVGKRESIDKEDNSLASVYFKLTLKNGDTFKKGDVITIEAMRNNSGGGKSSLYFLFDNGTSITDTYEWANLGLLREVNINVSSETSLAKPSNGNSTTEALEEFSLEPSTNSFTVPEQADGCTSLRLTRNESQCMLYITSMSITRKEVTTGIENINTTSTTGSKEYRFGPLLIKDGKKYIIR